MRPEDHKQPELFDEFPRVSKRGRRKFRFFKKLAITISHENFLFGAILILMAMVVCFTVGVERGKKIGTGVVVSYQMPQSPPVNKEITEVGKSSEIPVEMSKEEAVSIQEPIPTALEKVHYLIQLVTYTRRDYVDKELTKLKKQGFQPQVVRSGRFFKIVVGPYSSKKKATSVLKRFTSEATYSSAYIKKVE